MKGKTKLAVLAAVLSVGAMTLPSFAQQNPGGGGQGQGQNGGGGGGQGGQNGRGGNPQQWRQRMMDNLKEQLGATDDEFTALQPKIEKVMQMQRDLGAGRMQMFRGRNGGNGGPPGGNFGGNNNQDPSPLQQATTDLQTTLDNKDAKPEDIKTKLDAFRDAKSKVKDELTAAQKELKDLLTQRQEAVLVEMGILD
jgi:peptidoglycan hydrolase CwlO-like protein